MKPTFSSATSPTLTSGTFTVGSSGTSGKVVFSADTTFSSGVTLAFPSIAGERAAKDALQKLETAFLAAPELRQ